MIRAKRIFVTLPAKTAMATVTSDMASAAKPLETGGCVMDYYSPGGNELEKPFLTPSGLDNNSQLERRDMVRIFLNR